MNLTRFYYSRRTAVALALVATLVVLGDLTITAGVTEAMMREKITGISVFGDATAPPEIVGMLQALTTDAFGAIRASDGPGS